MAKRKKKRKNFTITQRDIEKGIRKKTAPPTRLMGKRRPEEKVHPARNPLDE